VDHIQERTYGIDIDSPDHGGFACVGFGNDQTRNLLQAGFKSDGKRAADAANSAVEGKLSDEQAVFDGLLGEAAVGADDPERHGQIEA
jgi:hypothetical protein